MPRRVGATSFDGAKGRTRKYRKRRGNKKQQLKDLRSKPKP